MAKLLTLFSFILAFQINSLFTTSTPTKLITSSKEQIQCTMCSSCENPCQPIPSPPPPPPPEIICEPPPPPACPPPPPPPCPPPPTVPECSPPCKPEPAGGDEVPYFTYYYKPQPSSFASSSVKLRQELVILSVPLFLTLLLLS